MKKGMKEKNVDFIIRVGYEVTWVCPECNWVNIYFMPAKENREDDVLCSKINCSATVRIAYENGKINVKQYKNI